MDSTFETTARIAPQPTLSHFLTSLRGVLVSACRADVLSPRRDVVGRLR